MSDSVVAMPGVTPVCKQAVVNEEAIAALEELLRDMRGGKYTALAFVAAGENDNWMKETVETCGQAAKVIGLGHTLLHRMQEKLAEGWG